MRARKVCCDQFLAALFLKIADDGRYKILKTKLNNDFLFGDKNAPLKIVEAKRVLSDYTVPVNSKVESDTNKGDEGTGLTFAETQEWVKPRRATDVVGRAISSVIARRPPQRKRK